MKKKKESLIKEVATLDAKKDAKFIVQLLAITKRHKWIYCQDKKTGRM